MQIPPSGRKTVTVMTVKRILVKMSGEALCGREGGFGFDTEAIGRLVNELAAAREQFEGLEMSLVIGGGNIFRGQQGSSEGLERSAADSMGMLATVMNALALQDALEKRRIPTRVQTAVEMPKVAEPYIRRRAIRHLEKGRVVIFAAGTGNPYFSTDTAAALRAMEMRADLLLKGTKVDGVYDSDPKKNPNAKFFPRMTFDDYIARKIGVMDTTAVTLCRDNRLPIRVFKMLEPGNLVRVLRDEIIGTTISLA